MIGCWKTLKSADTNTVHELICTSNQNLDRNQWLLVWALLSGTTLTVAVWMTWQGFWPVMVFAILHLFIVGIALIAAIRRNRHWLQIRIDDKNLCIEHHSHAIITSWQTSAVWLQLKLIESKTPAGKSVLILSSQDEQIVIGSFLDDKERRQLAEQLHAKLQGKSQLLDPLPGRLRSHSDLVVCRAV